MKDIPACLRLTREQRAAGWARYKPLAIPAAHLRIDTSPGGVARRLGYPESPEDVLARADIHARSDREAAAKREEDEARWAVLREQQRQDRAERKAVRAACVAAGTVVVKSPKGARHHQTPERC